MPHATTTQAAICTNNYAEALILIYTHSLSKSVCIIYTSPHGNHVRTARHWHIESTLHVTWQLYPWFDFNFSLIIIPARFVARNRERRFNLEVVGKLWSGGLGVRSQMLMIHNKPPSFVDVKLLDGAAVVHLLPTTNVVTFNEYADQIFLPYITKQLESCTRVDVVWDTYLPVNSELGKNEGKESVEKLQGTISCLENGLNFYVIQLINKNCLNSLLQSCRLELSC